MAYPQRTDLNNPAQVIARQAAKGQTYGEAAAQMEAQRQVPMRSAPSDVVANRPMQTAPMPGGLGDLARPTDRPNEPITALPAETYPAIPQNDSVLQELKVLYEMYPNEDLAAMLSSLQFEGR